MSKPDSVTAWAWWGLCRYCAICGHFVDDTRWVCSYHTTAVILMAAWLDGHDLTKDQLDILLRETRLCR